MSISIHFLKPPQKFLINFSVALALLILGNAAHPYYVGVTEVNIETAKKEVRVSCKLNLNDVQLSISQLTSKPIDLSTVTPQNVQQVSALVMPGLRLKVGSKYVNLTFLGYSIEDDAIWCFLQAKNVKFFPRVTVCNNWLYNQFETQTHFIHCIVNGGRKSSKLVNPETCANFVY